MANALTITGSGRLRELKCQILVGTPSADPTVPPLKMTTPVTAVWDTGASGSVITQPIVDRLELQPIAMTKVFGVNSETIRPVYVVDFVLPMNVGMRGLRVTLGELVGTDVLIGMDVITMGDFVITNQGGKTKMSFRVPSLSDFDFVQTENNRNSTRQERRAQQRGGKKGQR